MWMLIQTLGNVKLFSTQDYVEELLLCTGGHRRSCCGYSFLLYICMLMSYCRQWIHSERGSSSCFKSNTTALGTSLRSCSISSLECSEGFTVHSSLSGISEYKRFAKNTSKAIQYWKLPCWQSSRPLFVIQICSCALIWRKAWRFCFWNAKAGMIMTNFASKYFGYHLLPA